MLDDQHDQNNGSKTDIIESETGKINYNLPKENLKALRNENLEPFQTQMNFKLPKSLKDFRDETIKKDLLFYRRAYEDESSNINKIINSINILNNHLLPLKSINEALKKDQKNIISNLSSIHTPYNNKKEGLNEEMNSYQKDSKMTKELSDDIKSFLETFNILIDSVNKLKEEILNGLKIFENCAPEFEDLNDKKRIKNALKSLENQLKKITFLINPNTKIQKESLVKKMIEVCEELKIKTTTISQKINETRLKINLNKMQFPVLDIKELNIELIENNINNIIKKIEETNQRNDKIKENMEITHNCSIRPRLDILFIIDLTHTINTYLSDIKNNFTYMINSIIDNSPTATVYTGLIGYTDFSELDLGEDYINIDFTQDSKKICDKIRELDYHGGNDDAEDLCGAFDLALKMKWKGFPRFAILATDAPCHGIEFHNDEVVDNYPDGDRDGRDIKQMVRQFARNKISLICAKYGDTTEKMFEIFKKEYEKGQKFR